MCVVTGQAAETRHHIHMGTARSHQPTIGYRLSKLYILEWGSKISRSLYVKTVFVFKV